MNILGVSALYHDSAAALIVNGEIVAAAQEERFTRKKHDAQFPENSINYVLHEAGIHVKDIDYVVFYDKPFLKFERLLETYVSLSPKGFNSFRMAMPIWLREKLFLKDFLFKQFKKCDKDFQLAQLMFSEHHFSHAASAFYPSPFEESLVLTLDGVGEWATTSVAIGRGNKLNIVKELHFPHSLGLLYSAFTYYIGFKVNSGEYKLMGLAPYGSPRFKSVILEKLIDLKEDGTFVLNQSYFNYSTGLTMTNQKFSTLFSSLPRKAEFEELTQFHMDIAASIQAVTEEIIIKMTRSLRSEYNISNLCLAGGVALNCVANGKILRDNSYENIWIQPAAGDAGGAIGAALALWHNEFDNKRIVNVDDAMKGAFLGPSYSEIEVVKELTNLNANFTQVSRSKMIKTSAQLLSKGKAIGWFQGRMEFGPRALGGRSILGDPRSEKTQRNLNLKVKYRESFRPFAPSILAEYVSEWFEQKSISPYMLFVANIKESIQCQVSEDDELLFGIDRLNVRRSIIPAVTHVDYSARIQTVHKDTNQNYYDLISEFNRITDCPMVVNTSFNVRGEPIVCTPTDAFKCFMGTDLDALVIGNVILFKNEQNIDLLENYKGKYELD
jgi:carbamoyltransferase